MADVAYNLFDDMPSRRDGVVRVRLRLHGRYICVRYCCFDIDQGSSPDFTAEQGVVVAAPHAGVDDAPELPTRCSTRGPGHDTGVPASTITPNATPTPTPSTTNTTPAACVVCDVDLTIASPTTCLMECPSGNKGAAALAVRDADITLGPASSCSIGGHGRDTGPPTPTLMPVAAQTSSTASMTTTTSPGATILLVQELFAAASLGDDPAADNKENELGASPRMPLPLALLALVAVEPHTEELAGNNPAVMLMNDGFSHDGFHAWTTGCVVTVHDSENFQWKVAWSLTYGCSAGGYQSKHSFIETSAAIDFKITIQISGRTNLHHFLQLHLLRKNLNLLLENFQEHDVVLRYICNILV